MWTALRDTHAGGIQKLEWKWVVIEADEDEATSVFFSRFGINPNRVSCTCCGSDFSIWDDFDLDYIEDDEKALIIRTTDILTEERQTEVPIQGYVWK